METVSLKKGSDVGTIFFIHLTCAHFVSGLSLINGIGINFFVISAMIITESLSLLICFRRCYSQLVYYIAGCGLAITGVAYCAWTKDINHFVLMEIIYIFLGITLLIPISPKFGELVIRPYYLVSCKPSLPITGIST